MGSARALRFRREGGSAPHPLDHFPGGDNQPGGLVSVVARTVPVSVVETPEFLSATRKLMSDEERALVVDCLACNPTAGELIPGTGGVRKLRWGLQGRGKRGGARAARAIDDSALSETRIPRSAAAALERQEVERVGMEMAAERRLTYAPSGAAECAMGGQAGLASAESP